jgi:uncharacterized MAPEG superfamily protein
MSYTPNDQTLTAYAVTCLVLSLNLLFLWFYSGATRAGTKTAMNPEDGARFGVPVAELDPPAVARVLRAHANAQAAIYPFLLLGLVYVLLGGGATTATVIFAVFTFARLAHSGVYLTGKQPWRTIFFIAGGIATIALMVAIVMQLLR